jgi:mannose-6-phosphate isomerase-like protein (cupin superfamily)
MKKVNVRDIAENAWCSPRQKFGAFFKGVSLALGRRDTSTDLRERHPFDLEILRLAPGQTPYPYHLHSAQWELYHVTAGKGLVRHADGTTPIESGDAFLFRPNEPHQLTNTGQTDLVLLVIADNPIGESGYYPDSDKWIVRSPERRIMRGPALDYFDREE